MQHRTPPLAWVAVITLTAAVAGCGGDGDSTAASEPPWCLVGIELPDDADAIEATAAIMPDEHNGARREQETSRERVEVYYDEPLEGMPSFQAFSIDALQRAFPGAEELTGFEIMQIVLEAGTEPVDPGGVTGELEELSMDPEADLVWATGETVEVGETAAEDVRAPSVTFADPDGRWIFTITASTQEGRLELVEAFCEAVDS